MRFKAITYLWITLHKSIYSHLPALLLIACLAFACKKDPIDTDPDVRLEFSEDTVLFDTVFTTVGSSTQYLKVFNRNKKKINISSIYLAGGSTSKFRMNVDGIKGTAIKDVEIGGEDSMFIFIEVTLDPNNTNNPLVVTDSIVFNTNDNVQDVDLVAWGQDAYFYAPPKGYSAFLLPNCPETWSNDKPHVIYGYAVIDSACSLTIEAGTRVHFHNNSGLIALNTSSLHINGTASDPVLIAGDRLEETYKDIPGQWSRIWLSAGSINNTIDHAIIRNGSVGIQVDTVGNGNPTLKINNTVIENMTVAGLFAQGAVVDATNLMVSNCGQYTVALTLGGDYRFRHCTMANYWNYDVRQSPAVLVNNWYKDIDENIQHRDLVRAYFGNCIIYGGLPNEVGVDLKSGALGNYMFDHCILKEDGSHDLQDATHFLSITKTNPGFLERPPFIYALDTLSPAIDLGDPSITNASDPITTDITGNTRVKGLAPDLGAYEKD